MTKTPAPNEAVWRYMQWRDSAVGNGKRNKPIRDNISNEQNFVEKKS
jgi:hypothetical protein